MQLATPNTTFWLLVSAILYISTTLGSIDICPASGSTQNITGGRSGALVYNSAINTVNCKLVLSGFEPNAAIGILNILPAHDSRCDGFGTVSISGRDFCVPTNLTYQRVETFMGSLSLEISEHNSLASFELEYYQGDVICGEDRSHSRYVDISITDDDSKSMEGLLVIEISHDSFFLCRRINMRNPLELLVKIEIISLADTADLYPSILERLIDYIRFYIPDNRYIPSPQWDDVYITTGSRLFFDLDLYPHRIDLHSEKKSGFAIRYSVVTCDEESPKVTNGYFEQLPPHPWYINTTINYTCHPGYIVNMSMSAYTTCVLVGHYGAWADTQGGCTPRECTGFPSNISNGYASTGRNHTYVYMDRVKYHCDDGYTLYRDSITCQSDGTWSPTPICLPKQCPGLPPNISNGYASTRRNHTYVYMDRVRYHCDDGYTLYRDSITCQSDGTWSPTPICLPKQIYGLNSQITETQPTPTTTIILAVTSGVGALVIICLTGYIVVHKYRKSRTHVKGKTNSESTNADLNNPTYMNLQALAPTRDKLPDNATHIYENKTCPQSNAIGKVPTYEQLDQKRDENHVYCDVNLQQ